MKLEIESKQKSKERKSSSKQHLKRIVYIILRREENSVLYLHIYLAGSRVGKLSCMGRMGPVACFGGGTGLGGGCFSLRYNSHVINVSVQFSGF